MVIQGVPENSIPGKQNFFETEANTIFPIVCSFNFYIPLAFSRILNYENVTFLTEVIACFVRLIKFPCFLNKINYRPVLNHILTDFEG